MFRFIFIEEKMLLIDFIKIIKSIQFIILELEMKMLQTNQNKIET